MQTKQTNDIKRKSKRIRLSFNNQNRRNVEVKKKVWSVDTSDQQPQQQQMSHQTNANGHHSSVQQPANGIDVVKKISIL
ncbi:unnamed protein product [Rotaria sordida]|uniref:Uncharacterized protein n=1 Tax=Rotaria sordida TaxID=392033 RepID=A0A814DP08_9BILA|nr:unnamed protein product [Rotaria sordida]